MLSDLHDYAATAAARIKEEAGREDLPFALDFACDDHVLHLTVDMDLDVALHFAGLVAPLAWPKSITFVAEGYTREGEPDEDTPNVGDVAAEYVRGDPRVHTCLNVLTVYAGGETRFNALTYFYSAGRVVWHASPGPSHQRGETSTHSGFVVDVLRAALLEPPMLTDRTEADRLRGVVTYLAMLGVNAFIVPFPR